MREGMRTALLRACGRSARHDFGEGFKKRVVLGGRTQTDAQLTLCGHKLILGGEH
jgi:hypothetical protein